MDWSHTKKRGRGNIKGYLTVESSGKQEEVDQRIAGVIKEEGRSWNELSFLAADKTEVERIRRQPTLLIGTADSVIIKLVYLYIYDLLHILLS
jgi:hypothetical protein